jgi:tRNA U34 5-carboxymethylaminomethyl modifying enzyme MnmG/GidA
MMRSRAFQGTSNTFERVRPASLGQASRIDGITPAALSILAVWLKRKNEQQNDE